MQPEWKPLKTSSTIADIIMQARSTHTLRVSNEEEIKQVLRYSMVLVGLRANNMPTDEEKFVLLNFIKLNYGNFGVAEIKIAFEMAVAGKFQIDVKCYENFSCEYFGRIMNAYSEFARNETFILMQKSQESSTLPEPTPDEQKLQAIESLNFYADRMKALMEKKKDVDFFLGGIHVLFTIARKHNLINLSDEVRRIIKDKNARIKDVKEFDIKCKSDGYLYQLREMVDFEVRFDNNGNLKQI